jgi:hypothetical protein
MLSERFDILSASGLPAPLVLGLVSALFALAFALHGARLLSFRRRVREARARVTASSPALAWYDRDPFDADADIDAGRARAIGRFTPGAPRSA